MRTTFINTLLELARMDDRVFVITPDLGFSVLEKFREEFPNRFLNVGIAEQNAVGVAAGLAMSGKVVYVYSIIPFVTMRCFEQIRVDVAYMNTNVRLVGVGAGLSYGPQGATHHSLEDIAIMRALPNMTVCCPGDPIEVKEIVTQSLDYEGPMYIRLGKNGEPVIHDEGTTFRIGQAIEVTQGNDAYLISTSNTLELADSWVKRMANQGVSVGLISVPTVKPLDREKIVRILLKGKPVSTLEEHSISGGLGTAVAEVIAESGQAVKFKRFALPDEYCHFVGDQHYLRDKLGLTFESFEQFIETSIDK
ncbi:transketolase family protein [Cohnella abietis]|uniref:1-deoxy-D-xylulose-5-phosphate synthase n=1 Tax=Cohnella abietis TaxID=2507935 RepID=A0A3T1DDS5_9BACL|nr:transketolase C-terminal domain-containing protein [Cohnella abietis]BBI36128.1 1-deoxy-D-xylulose-5-phosphate synthase [Cohnella abietis]